MFKVIKKMIPRTLKIALILLILFLPILTLAQDYQLLQPEVIEGASTEFTDYAKALFTTILVVAAVLAIIMFVWGGIEYAVSSVPGIKTEGLNRIWAALGGLLIALMSWLILNTINPELLNFNLDGIGRAGINIGGGTTPSGPGGGRPTTPGTPPTGPGTPTTPGGPSLGEGIYGPVPENEFAVRAALEEAGFDVVDIAGSGAGLPCNENDVRGCSTYVGNLNQAQLEGLFKIQEQCNCGEIKITGAGETGGHTGGSNHYTGNAVDIDDNNGAFNSFIQQNRTALGIKNTNIFHSSHWHLEF